MRILSLSNSPLDPTLGSGKTVVRWTEGLRSHGHDCLVLGRDAFLQPPWNRLPGRRFWMALGAWRVLQRQIRTFAPDLVECYGGEFGVALRLARRRRRRPCLVAHTNGLEELAARIQARDRRDTAGFLHRRLDRASLAHADRFLALCEADRSYVLGERLFENGHTAVIEPALDEEFLRHAHASLGGRDHAVAFTGSWVERKDPATVVAVMQRLLAEDSALTFHVFGATPAVEEIRASFSPEVQGRLQIAGKLTNDELAAALTRCKAFFFPSRYEGYGIAVAEAMVCGCAVVTTPTGLGGSLCPGVEAEICPAGDRDAFAEALRQILRDDARRESIATAGRGRVVGLTWSAQCAALHRLYSDWAAHA